MTLTNHNHKKLPEGIDRIISFYLDRNPKSILLVHPKDHVGNNLALLLSTGAGYHVDMVEKTEDAKKIMQTSEISYDLVILNDFYPNSRWKYHHLKELLSADKTAKVIIYSDLHHDNESLRELKDAGAAEVIQKRAHMKKKLLTVKNILNDYHILFGNGDKKLIDLTARLKEEYGYTITNVHNGEDAVEIFGALNRTINSIDLLVFDINMPGIADAKGVTIMKKIKRMEPLVNGVLYSPKTHNEKNKIDLHETDFIFISGNPREIFKKVHSYLKGLHLEYVHEYRHF